MNEDDCGQNLHYTREFPKALIRGVKFGVLLRYDRVQKLRAVG